MLGVGAKGLAGMKGPGLMVEPLLVLGIETISTAAIESGNAREIVLGLV